MSRQIDERVVSMQFDNKEFKKNVSETIKNLDDLDKKLKLQDSVKGFDNLAKAANKVDLSQMGKSADTVAMRFSAMNMVAMSAINNIVTSAMNAGKKIVKALTIEPVSQGFNEYELKMQSVQTIMASTGASIEQVNQYLEELNTYSDKTIYSFSDMTNNIGKFTNAGVKLDMAVKAIQGISNEAAVSGANANEASRAMYNFAQALSAGYVKLIDWKSIENANMATVEFKNQLIETGVALGTLVEQDGMYITTTTDAQGKVSDLFNATKGFNDALSNQWMTTEVLTQTLARYASETEDIGKKAFAAAQDVKTFSMLMDTLKEAVGSGWAQTYEIIFGDFEEAKQLWTGASNAIGNLISAMSESRNSLLRGGLASGWKQFINTGVANVDFLKEQVMALATDSIEGFDKMIEEAGGFEQSLSNGWLTADLLNGGIENVTKAIQSLSDEELRNKGFTEESVKQWAEFVKKVKDGTISIDDFVAKMSKSSGRQNLIESIKIGWQNLLDVIKPVQEAINMVFPPMTAERLYQMTEALKNFVAQFKLTDTAAQNLRTVTTVLLVPLRLLLSAVKTAATLFGYFTLAVFKMGDALLQLVSGAGPIPALFNKIFGNQRYNRIAKSLATISTNLADAFSKIAANAKAAWEAFKGSDAVSGTLSNIRETLAAIAGGILDKVVEGFEALAKVDYTRFATIVSNGFARVSTSLEKFWAVVRVVTKAIRDAFVAFMNDPSTAIQTFKDGIAGLDGVIGELPRPIKIVIDILSKMFDVVKRVGVGMANFVKNLTPAKVILFGFSAAVVGMGIQVINMMTAIGKAIEAGAKIMTSANTLINAFTMRLKPNVMVQFAEAVGILTLSLVVLSMLPVEQTGNAIMLLGGAILALVGVTQYLSNIARMAPQSAAAMGILSRGLLEFAAAVGIMSLAMMVLSKIEGHNLWEPLGAIAALIVGFTALSAVLTNVFHVQTFIKGAGTIIAFSGAVLLLSIAMESLGKANLDDVGDNIVQLVAIIASLGILAAAANGLKFGGSVGVLVLVGALMAMVAALKSLAKVDTVELLTGIVNFIPVITALSGLMLVTRIAAAQAADVAKSALMITIAALLISKVIQGLESVSWSGIGKAAIVVGGLIGLFTLFANLVTVVGPLQTYVKLGGTFIAMAGAIMLLSVAIDYIGSLPVTTVAKGTVAVLAILRMFRTIMTSGKISEKAKTSIMAIVVAIGVLTAGVAILAMFTWSEVLRSVGGMFLIMTALGAVFNAARGLAVGGGIAAAIIAISSIAGVVVALKLLSGTEDALENALALTMVMGAVAIACAAVGVAGKLLKTGDVLQGAMAMVAALIPLAIVTILLGTMTVDGSTIQKAEMLALVCAGLGILALAVGAAGKLMAGMAAGIATFGGAALLVLALCAGVVIAMEAITVDPLSVAQKMLGFTVAIGAMAALVLALSFVGNLLGGAAGIATTGPAIIAMIVYIVGIMGVALLLAGLCSKLSEQQEAIDAGFAVMASIAAGIGDIIGRFIGGIIGGLKAGYMDSMLSATQTMVTMADTFSGIKSENIDQSAGVIKTIAESMKELAVANAYVEDQGGLDNVGQALEDFAPHVVAFGTSLDSLSYGAVSKVKMVAEAMGELSNALPTSGGAFEFFTGKKDLGDFGKNLEEFATGFVNFYNKISEVEIDTSITETCATVATSFSELNKSLPRSGGALQDFLGDKELDTWGAKLANFGSYFVQFYRNLTSNGAIDSAIIQDCASAAQAMAELNKNLPSDDGVLQSFLGSKDLSVFGQQLSEFGSAFVSFYTTISSLGDLDESVVTTAANMAGTMAALADEELPTSGGVLDWFTGSVDIKAFGDGLLAFGNGFASFYRAISGVGDPEEANAMMVAAFDLINDLNTRAQQVYDGGSFGTYAFADVGNGLTVFADGIKRFIDAAVNLQGAGDVDFETLLSLDGEKLMLAIINGIESKYPDMTLAGTSARDAFLTGVNTPDESGTNLLFAANFVYSVNDYLKTDNGSKPSGVMYSIGVNCVEGFINGIKADMGNIEGLGTELGEKLVNATEKATGVNSPSVIFYNIGENCIAGLANGITESSNTVLDSAISMATSLLDSVLSFFGINSPSTVMRDEVGRYLVEGIADGITSDMSAVEAAQQMAQNITSAFQDEIDKFDVDFDTLDLEQELWEALHPGASDSPTGMKMTKKAQMLDKKLVMEANKVNIAQAQYLAAVQSIGEENDATQELYNAYLQEQISMARMAQEYAEATGSDYSEDSTYARDISEIVEEYMAKATDTVNTETKQVEVITSDSLTSAMENAINDAVGSVSGGGGAAYSGGVDIANAIGNGVSDGTESYNWKDSFDKVFGEGGALSEALNLSEAELPQPIQKIFDLGDEALSKITESGKTIFNKFIGAVNDASNDKDTGTTAAANAMIDSLSNNGLSTEANLQKVSDSANEVFGQVSTAADESAAEVDETTQNEVDNVVGKFEATEEPMKTAGKNATKGFEQGLNDEKTTSSLYAKAKSIAGKVVETFRKELDEHSPSKVMYDIGAMVTEGFANGISDGEGKLTKEMQAMCLNAIDTAVQYIDQEENMIDYPVISPVVDDSWTRQLQNQFYDTVLQFDSNGTLVPYSYNNGENMPGEEKGTWIKVDEETARKAREIADQVYDAYDNNDPESVAKWGAPFWQAERTYDGLDDQLLRDIYDAALASGNKGEIRATDAEWQQAPSYNFTQNNYSPVSLPASEIYRNSKSLMSQLNTSKTMTRTSSNNDYALKSTR